MSFWKRRQIVANKNKAGSISAVPNAPHHGSETAGQCRVGIDWTPTVTEIVQIGFSPVCDAAARVADAMRLRVRSAVCRD